MRFLAIPAVVATAVLSSACLQQDTTHTIYLSPDGAAKWTVIERDIRSDAKDPSPRLREEQQFVDRLAAGEHPVAVALQHLVPDALQMRVLRRERPYAVMTEARFARIDWMVQHLLRELSLQGSSTLARAGQISTLTIAIELPVSDEGVETPVLALADTDAPYKLMLTEGRFVSATGFSIQGDGAAATIDETAFDGEDIPRTVTLVVSWTH